jgi:hypothetical protein
MKLESTFTTVPLMRGFTEIAALWELATKHDSMICGGYARYCCSQIAKPHPASDVDLFPQSEEGSAALVAELIGLGFSIKHENEISVTFKREEEHPDPRRRVCPTIQVIKPVREGAIVTVGPVREILNNFDFTIVRAALLSPTEGLVDEDFIADDSEWKLKLKNIHCPVSSLMRCIKYSKKGYWLGVAESLKLFLDWNERGPDYQAKLAELILGLKKENGEEPSKEDIEELEKLMNVE